MLNVPIEQAIYGDRGSSGRRVLARSPGFAEEWLPDVERLCTVFGERPPGTMLPACLFAQPLGKRHVAVIQAADPSGGASDRFGLLWFHLLVLGQRDYALLGGDPFQLAERYPASWQV